MLEGALGQLFLFFPSCAEVQVPETTQIYNMTDVTKLPDPRNHTDL